MTDQLEAVCERFEEAWSAGDNPTISDFVPPEESAGRTAILQELVRIDLEFRWKNLSGESATDSPLRTSDYVGMFPELGATPADWRDLLAEEFRVRHRWGDQPAVDAFLAEYPAAEASLKETLLQVNSNLAAEGSTFVAANDLGDTVTAVGNSAGGGEAPQPSGSVFGSYELIEEIARGGMGVVFKARQRNLNRVVALKMILAGQLASPEDVNRFQTEATAAARLDHPHIVPIHEVGEHDGRHFFSMGFVEGESLAEGIKEHPLQPRVAAELVKTISAAVQYAHERGVVHRDLKPANVLIDRSGQPRVTDFGLAKIAAADSELTATGQVMGTPSYMPPEQASGKNSEIGPLADVYSLGATLYCLVAGRPPFQAASLMETLRLVLEKEPIPLRQLNPAVDRDLETICMKCLEKEPGRRYRSAAALANDLERYLNGEPIVARPLSTPARAWRWCRRNRAVAALLAAVAVSIVVGTSTSVAYAWKFRSMAARRLEAQKLAEDETKRANQAAADSDEAHRLIVDTVLADEVMREPRFQPLRQKLLASSLDLYGRRLEQMRESGRESDKLEALTRRVGEISRATGRHQDAQQAWRMLVESLESAVEGDDAVTKKRLLVGALYDLAESQLSLDDRRAARSNQRRAIAMQEEIVQQTGEAIDHLTLGKLYDLSSRLHLAERNLVQAARDSDRSLKSMQIASEKAPDEPVILLSISRRMNNRFLLLMRQSAARAASYLAQVVALRKSLAERLPDSIEVQHAYARILIRNGRFRNDVASADKAITILRPLVARNPHFHELEFDLALAFDVRAGVMFNTKRFAEAREPFEKAIGHLRRLVYSHPEIGKYKLQLSMSVHNASLTELNLGKPDRALDLANQAVGMQREMLKYSDHDADAIVSLATALKSLAQIQNLRPATVEASIQSCHSALSLLQQLTTAESIPVLIKRAEIHHTLAVTRLKQGPGKAFPPLNKAIELQRKAFEADRSRRSAGARLSLYLLQLGTLYRQHGRFDDAVGVADLRVKIWPDEPGYLYLAAVEVAQTLKDLNPEKGKATLPEKIAELKKRLPGKVLQHLRAAVRAGFADAARLSSESAFLPLQNDKEFQSLKAQIVKRARNDQKPRVPKSK